MAILSRALRVGVNTMVRMASPPLPPAATPFRAKGPCALSTTSTTPVVLVLTTHFTYPAVSAGWNIKNEAFMDNVVWLNQLKLRVGYGQTSNQSIDPYSTLGRLSTRPYNFGDSFATGFYVSELPNPNLGWEFTETMNYGLDFSLLSHRLSGTFEYYQQTTKDLLFRVNLPSTSGVGSYMANIGESENKGFELSLNGVIVDDRNGWSWDAGINLYANRNKLTKLASGQERDENNWWFVTWNYTNIWSAKDAAWTEEVSSVRREAAQAYGR